eukprot:SAG11_NODE_25171_length_362_cov_2.741445_1_plen_25_part_01
MVGRHTLTARLGRAVQNLPPLKFTA